MFGRYHSDLPQSGYSVFTWLAVVDELNQVFAPFPASYIAPYLRVGLLIFRGRSIREQLYYIFSTLRPLFGTAIVLAALLFFWSWAGARAVT